MGIEIESEIESDKKQDRNVVGPNSPSKADESAVSRASTTLESIDDLQRELDQGEVTGELSFALPPSFLLSIVVPVYNEKNTIARVIRTLHDLPLPIEVIAVDDGSTDGSIAEPVRTPDFTIAIGASYTAEFGGGLSLVPSINANWR